MKERRGRKKGGFSLVEVCMAILVVGLGLMSIFSMFPTGLAASESAAADTETGLFAAQVFAGLQAVATEVSWSQWKKMPVSAADFKIPDGGAKKIEFYYETMNADNNIRYKMVFATPTSRVDRVKEVTLSLASLRTSPVVTNVFYTEIYYMELP